MTVLCTCRAFTHPAGSHPYIISIRRVPSVVPLCGSSDAYASDRVDRVAVV
jgi:hypothetical protein